LKLADQAIGQDHFMVASQLDKLALAEAKRALDKELLAQAKAGWLKCRTGQSKGASLEVIPKHESSFDFVFTDALTEIVEAQDKYRGSLFRFCSSDWTGRSL